MYRSSIAPVLRSVPWLFVSLASVLPCTPARADSQQEQPSYSQVEGQLVPVGDRHRYRYDYATTNLDINPMGPLMGYWSAGISHAVHPYVAIRADFSLLAPYDSKLRLVDAALTAKIHFRKVNDDWFVEPGLRLLVNKEGRQKATTGIGPQVLVGKQWLWDSGLNLALAVGLSRTVFGEMADDASVILPAGYVRVGKTF